MDAGSGQHQGGVRIEDLTMAMSTPDLILQIVGEWNEKGMAICQKELAEMKINGTTIAAIPTLNKYINELIEDGRLTYESEQTPHGTRKNLYVNKGAPVHREQLFKRLIFEISRVADALEIMSEGEIKTRGKRETKSRFRQQRLRR